MPDSIDEEDDITEDDILIDLLFDDGRWIKFPVDLTSILTLHEVVLLAELYNQARILRKFRKKSDRWFRYTVEDIKNRINFSEDTQRRTIDKLVERGFIETERRGSPPFRHVRIKSSSVKKALIECDNSIPRGSAGNAERTGPEANCTNVQTPRKCGAYPAEVRGITTNVKRSIKEMSPPSRECDDTRGLRGFFPSDATEPEKDDADILAQNLYAGLVEKCKVTKIPKLTNWAADIRKFLLLPGRTTELFEQLMIKYLEHINDEFMPEAYSARSFCEKYPNIESALRRKGNSSGDSSEGQVDRIMKLIEKEEERRNGK